MPAHRDSICHATGRSSSSTTCRPSMARALMASSARSNDVKERMLRDGADTVGGTPQEFAQLIKTELKRWGEVVKLSGARVD